MSQSPESDWLNKMKETELLDILRSNSGLTTPPRSCHWGKPCLQSLPTFFRSSKLFLSSWEENLSPSRTLNGTLALFSLILITLTFPPQRAPLCVLCLVFFNLIAPWFHLRDPALLFLQSGAIYHLNTPEHNYLLFIFQISAQLSPSRGNRPQSLD